MDGVFGALLRLSRARSRSISAENVYGEPGRGGMAVPGDEPQPEVVRLGQVWDPTLDSYRKLGPGWKARPCIILPPRSVTTLAEIDGPGCITHFWITTPEPFLRKLILRMYWDGEEAPSVEVPLGDFFCNALGDRQGKFWTQINAIPINVNHYNGMNCFFPMPFRKHARITVENLDPETPDRYFFYTFNYELRDELPPDTACFHASFRRVLELPVAQDFAIADGIMGQGNFAGCYLVCRESGEGGWCEGEVKMYLDGDGAYPTICGTGTEDYFGGAWCFAGGEYTYSAPCLGYPFGDRSGAGARHAMYRFHLFDPIHFQQRFRMTIQNLSGRYPGRTEPLPGEYSAVAYWYQREPHAATPHGDWNSLPIF